MNKPVAIVLGGTAPHVLLISKLKDRGYYVILADYLDNPPAKIVADEHIKASTLDQDRIVEIAKEKHASLVISTCIDQANSVCCYVAEKLNLPHPYSFQTSLDVTDKGLMKKIMVDNNIPTSAYQIVTSISDIDWSKILYPAVVKPVDCNSSKGVRRVDADEETLASVQDALALSRTHHAIIEGFNKGVEIQVDCIASDDVKVMMTRQKQKVPAGDNEMVLQSVGSIFPAPLSDSLNIQAKEIAEKIAHSFNLRNTPFFYQAIVTDNGIQVLEFAPRIGGGLSYYVLKEYGAYDAVECAIDSFLGNQLKVTPKIPQTYLSTNLLYMNPGIFDHVEGLEEQQKNGLVKDFFVMKSKGTEVDGDMRSTNRVAAFISVGNSYKEIMDKACKVISKIKVLDSNGNDLLKRELYSNF